MGSFLSPSESFRLVALDLEDEEEDDEDEDEDEEVDEEEETFDSGMVPD